MGVITENTFVITEGNKAYMPSVITMSTYNYYCAG